jgi:hypothetical protein
MILYAKKRNTILRAFEFKFVNIYTPILFTKFGTKFRRKVAVAKSVEFTCGLKATEFKTFLLLVYCLYYLFIVCITCLLFIICFLVVYVTYIVLTLPPGGQPNWYFFAAYVGC